MPKIKGSLKEEDEAKITRNLNFLKKELDGKFLVNHMLQGDVFDFDDKDEILRLDTKASRTELFLEKLCHSGPYQAYEVFLNALRKDYPHVADRLVTDDQESAVKTHGAPYSASSPPSYDVELLLLGKTGAGTSSTGNTILGKEHFQTSDKADSCTAYTQSGWVNRQGLTVKVVDGAAILDNRLVESKRIEQIQENLTKAFLHCPKGFHALVLVLRYGVRFNKEERPVVEYLKGMLGSNFIQNHGILIITNADIDLFMRQNRKRTFKDWCMEQTGSYRDLIDECGGRVVLFQNLMPKEAKESTEPTDQLIAFARGLRRRYTVEMFELIASDRAKFIETQSAILFKKGIKGLIHNIIKLLDEENPDHQELQKRVQELKEKIGMEKQTLKVMQDLKQGIEQISTNRYTEALQTFKRNYNDD